MLTILDEELDMDVEEVDRRINLHGKIVVSVRRGERVKTNIKPSRGKLWDGYDAPNTRISSKAVVKDNHVSHAIR